MFVLDQLGDAGRIHPFNGVDAALVGTDQNTVEDVLCPLRPECALKHVAQIIVAGIGQRNLSADLLFKHLHRFVQSLRSGGAERGNGAA